MAASPLSRFSRPTTRTLVALLATLPGVAWAIVRIGGLDSIHPFVAIVAFTPYVAAACVVPLTIALLLRVWRVAALAGIVLIVLGATLVGRLTADGQPPARGPIVTVMTANVLRGNDQAAEFLGLVRSKDVDILGLQELEPEFSSGLRRAGMGELLPHALDDSLPGFAGSGLWSRSALRRTGSQTVESVTDATEGEQTSNGLRVRVVHPVPPTSPGRVAKWRRGLNAIPCAACDSKLPRIVIGDFNATHDHSAFRSLLSRGYKDAADSVGKGLIATWPHRGRRKLTLDHILVHQSIRVISVEIVRIPGSDHRAVIARLQLPAPPDE
ncbi:MAG: endonuclease/exonuclease/phosphatase family protein [Solirubrobacterales bacterium]